MSVQAAPSGGSRSGLDAYPRIEMFIDGEWTAGSGDVSEDVYDPATGRVIGSVPHAAAADLDRALAAAERGFQRWWSTPVAQRTAILHRAAVLLRERATEVGTTMTLEQGKPLRESTGEATRVAGTLDFDAEEGRRIGGRIIDVDPDTELTVVREPIGPVAAFTPWNFPAGGPMRKIAGALSAGCSIVIKASEETPGTAVQLVRCFAEAGLPDGVLNLVFGVPADISAHLIASPVVRMVAFTGSVPVGKRLAAMAAGEMKPTIMELGGHAPVVVCADADPELAAARTAQAKFVNAGQVCTSPSRMLVHESLYDRFVSAFVAAAEAVVVGNGLDDGVTMGPLANPRRLDAVTELVADARARGAEVLTGGTAPGGDGWFYPPTVLTGVDPAARIMREEPFGPLAPIMPFSELDEALGVANALPYGLAAYAYTESAATAARLKRGLQAGILSINHCGGSVSEAPSGGYKDSGYGREGGAEGLHGYLHTKRILHKLR